jgi:hypothetical protein
MLDVWDRVTSGSFEANIMAIKVLCTIPLSVIRSNSDIISGDVTTENLGIRGQLNKNRLINDLTREQTKRLY